MKAITAILVILALLLPRWGFLKKIPSLRNRGGRVPPKEAAAETTAPATAQG